MKIKMKTKKIKLFLLMLPVLIATGGCKDYLNVPSEAAVTEEKVFSTYNLFQGFVDQMYPAVLDHNRTYYTCTGEMGGEAIAYNGNHTSARAVRGNYTAYLGRGYYQVDGSFTGIWDNGWRVIRMCNMGLKNLKAGSLVATDEEKKLIEGQLLFFRAYFHFEIAAAWGPMPYIKEVLTNELQKPRFYEYKGKKNFQATMEYCIDDFDAAAKLLPVAWPDPTTQLGRLTALAALSYKAKMLLWAGSPLMNENSGGAAVVNKDYMAKAAIAADEAIKMAESNPASYGLMDAANYDRNFATTDRTVPWTKETVLALYRAGFGMNVFSEFTGRSNAVNTSVFGGNSAQSTPTQNYVDKFEMANGTLYNPAVHDANNALRWDSRDPRFRRNIYVDKDFPCTGKQLTMYTLPTKGPTIASDDQMTPYVIKKYWPFDVSNKGGTGNVTKSNNYNFCNPQMRLADVYLMYAEAANWAYGDGNNGDVKAPGANYTALAAVNKVRQRFPSGTPSATNNVWAAPYDGATTATGGPYGSFHKMVMNERAVELCYESNHYWNDLRRYKIGETLHDTGIYTLDFDKNYTIFQRRLLLNFVFDKRNYWLPFPTAFTYIYEGFSQNDGWN